jgi:hypothetical protein
VARRLSAVTDTLLGNGGLMRSVNPLIVHGEGEGATALDALMLVG